ARSLRRTARKRGRKSRSNSGRHTAGGRDHERRHDLAGELAGDRRARGLATVARVIPGAADVAPMSEAVIMIVTLAKSVAIEAELARRGIMMKRAGRELVGPCLVCGGTDRFAVNIGKQVWNCRGCAKGGDVIDLVQHLDGTTFRKAVKTLSGEQSRPTPTRTP